jgi:hypothetical protein
MKYLLTLLLSLIIILPVGAAQTTRPAQSATNPVNKTVDIKGKVVKKNIVVKDRAGRKKICNKVFDKKIKKEYLVCN